MSQFVKKFSEKLVDAFLRLVTYLLGSIILTVAGLSLMSGKFPPPFSDIKENFEQAKSSLQELSRLKGVMQAQQKNQKLQELLSDDMEKLGASRQIAEVQEFKVPVSLRAELDFMKSQLMQARLDIEHLKKTCQPASVNEKKSLPY